MFLPGALARDLRESAEAHERTCRSTYAMPRSIGCFASVSALYGSPSHSRIAENGPATVERNQGSLFIPEHVQHRERQLLV